MTMLESVDERLDIVVFAATGSTGKPTVKEINTMAKQRPLKWGIAGRSEEKLRQVLEDLKMRTGDDFSDVKIIIADINDDESLKKMTEQAKIIVNCCGPYRLYGEQVVKACIATNTHHLDISGEPQYMERMQLEYHKTAQEKGIYIISSCGFDSVPCDLGVVYCQQLFDGTVNDVETYLTIKSDSKLKGPRFHYATWESVVYGARHQNELAPLRQKLYPDPLPKFKPKQSGRSPIHKCPVDQSKWAIPFLGADKLVVERTQRHFYDHDRRRPAQISTYMTIPSLWGVFIFGMYGMMLAILAKFRCGTNLLLKHPKFFTRGWSSREGPSEEIMESTKFSVTIIGRGWSKDKASIDPSDQPTVAPNKTTTVKVSGTNMAYGATCVILVMCAMTLLDESNNMPDKVLCSMADTPFEYTLMKPDFFQYHRWRMNPRPWRRFPEKNAP